MRAGRLRHRVDFQRLSGSDVDNPTLDGFGGAAGPWVTIAARVPASVEPLQATEFFASSEHRARVTHRIRLRYRAGLAPAMRVLFEDRVFTIRAMLNPRERDRELQVMCEEQSPEVPAGVPAQ